MRISTGVPTASKGVPPVREKFHQTLGIDPHHESYVYSGVPTDVSVILIFSFGVPPGDAI